MTMVNTRKLEQVREYMKKAKPDTLGVGETRWAGNGDFISDQI